MVITVRKDVTINPAHFLIRQEEDGEALNGYFDLRLGLQLRSECIGGKDPV